jgi:SAM-dependent methyltransferase
MEGNRGQSHGHYCGAGAVDYAYSKSWSKGLGRVFAETVDKALSDIGGDALRVLEYGAGPAYSTTFLLQRRPSKLAEVFLEDTSSDLLEIGKRHVSAVANTIHLFPHCAFGSSEIQRPSAEFLHWLPPIDVDGDKGLNVSFLTLVTEYLTRPQIINLLVALLQRTANQGVVFVADWSKHPEYRGKEAEHVQWLSGICKATWLSILADVVRIVEAEDEHTGGTDALTSFDFPASQSSSSIDRSYTGGGVSPAGAGQPHPRNDGHHCQHKLVASQETDLGRRKARVRVELTITDLPVTTTLGKEAVEADTIRSRQRSSSSISTASSVASDASSRGAASSLASASSSSSLLTGASEDSPLADVLFGDGNGDANSHTHVRSASQVLKDEGASSRQIHMITLKKTMTPL